jgi:hypothetical protein
MIPVEPKENPSMREPNRVNCLVLTFALCAPSSLFAQTNKPAASPRKPAVQVPFVGCKSDGQMGPQDAPTGKPKRVTISFDLAQRLAYYEAENGVGVLAPRGWYCFETYGSGGSNLFVSPTPINPADPLSENWKGFPGAALQYSLTLGGTSGRFEVAEIVARVFPAYKAFVTRVIAEGIEPASSFPFGPYPKDKLTYRSNKVVEYQTPPDSDGLGTSSMLLKGPGPISGVAMLAGVDTDLIHLSMRLPANLTDLAAAVVSQTERDAAKPDH